MSNQANSESVMKRYLHWIILVVFIIVILLTNPSPDEALSWGSQNIVYTSSTAPHGVPEFHMRHNLSIADRNNFFLFSVYHIDVNLTGIEFGDSFEGTPRFQRFTIIGVGRQFFFL